MTNPDSKKWIKLELFDRKDYILAGYEDGLGNKIEPGQGEYADYGFLLYKRLHLPVKMLELFDQVLNTEPIARQFGNEVKRIPVAVYIDTGRLDDKLRIFFEDFGYWPWNRFVLQQIGVNPYLAQVIAFSSAEQKRGFSLPLNLSFIGNGGPEFKEMLGSGDWYREHEAVSSHGINFRTFYTYFDWENHGDPDILILRDPTPGTYGQLFSNEKPAPFVIILNEDYHDFFDRDPFDLKQGALLYVTYTTFNTALEFVKNLVYGIINDCSLHEALHYSLIISEGHFNIEAVLFASPDTNQGLRISTAVDSYISRVKDLNIAGNADIAQFLDKIDDTSPYKDLIAGYLQQHNDFGSLLGDADRLSNKFNGGISGFIDLSKAVQNFSGMEGYFQQINTKPPDTFNNPEGIKIWRKAEVRKVDVTMDKLSGSLTYTTVRKEERLEPRKIYRVNIKIGQPATDSLMVGKVDAIGPSLPVPVNGEKHEIEVAVFPKDFTLRSPSLQRIKLPLVGPSEQAVFEVEAPECRYAELRIALFFKNNLLQSFLLQSGESGVEVTMDLYNTEKFNNLNELPHRDLYIGMNKDTSGTHTLFVKKDEVACELFGLTPQLIEDAQNRVADLLTTAYFNEEGQPKFDPLHGQPNDDFFRQVRKFADYGSDYSDKLFSSKDTSLKTELRNILRSKDALDIQIGRHLDGYSFPWQMIYDYSPPPPLVGTEYPVCTGEKLEGDQYIQFMGKAGDVYGCPHNPGMKCYCVHGFWGVRHRIEQVFTKGEENAVDLVSEIDFSANGKVHLVRNKGDDYYSKLLEDYLSEKFAAGLTIHQPDVNLMDLLWDNNQRPSILIVFGHMETKMLTGEPGEPRIKTFPGNFVGIDNLLEDKWIFGKRINQICKAKNSWEGIPFPLVMLINCSAARMNVHDINSIASGFYTAGAGPIICTEINISSGLGYRFVTEVLEGLVFKGLQLGESIRLFNNSVLQTGNPLPFVFTCYGNNNLKVK